MTLSKMLTRMTMKHGCHQCYCLIQMKATMMTKKWKASPVRPADFVLTYNQTKLESELNYIQEFHEVKGCILDGTNIIKSNHSEGSVSATDTFNVFMPTLVVHVVCRNMG